MCHPLRKVNTSRIPTFYHIIHQRGKIKSRFVLELQGNVSIFSGPCESKSDEKDIN